MTFLYVIKDDVRGCLQKFIRNHFYGVSTNMMNHMRNESTSWLKRILLCRSVFFYGLFLLSAAFAARAESAPPNVVLILSDDQHWRDYGFMGHEHLQTPALDRLASESLVFSRGYVPTSLCCPSLASLITGRYPHEHLIVGNDPPTHGIHRRSPEGQKLFESGREEMTERFSKWPTLPKLLGEHGYRSLQTGKWWQGHFSRGGFDEGMTEGSRHGDQGLAIGRKTMQPVFDFIDRCSDAEQPFFVWYAPMLPHSPHDPEKSFVEHYESKADSIHIAKYWGNVERFDTTVGNLIDHLDTKGLSENTLVLYVCDNGWITNPENGRYAGKSKRSPYDGGLRTPIMLRQPGTIQPGTSDSLASSLDLVPTVLASCQISAPKDLPGINLLDQEAVRARKQLFGACYVHTLADIEKPGRNLLWRWTVKDVPNGEIWKLIEPATYGAPGSHSLPKGETNIDAISREAFEKGEVQLFDVAVDPDEEKNVAAANPDVVKHLQHELNEWWQPQSASVAVEPVATAPKKIRVLPVKARRKSSDLSVWPNWRGPTLDGVSSGTGYATSWSQEDNIKWRVQLPGLGASTPAVWGDQIVLTCDIEGHDGILCVDRAGQECWRQQLGDIRPGKHKKATGCNSSPVTDGKHVWVYFKSGELACLSLTDGAVVWRTNLQEQFGEDTLWWDLGTSPVLTQKAVVVAVMQTGPSYIVAFDRLTGDVLWKHDRILDAPEEAAQSYSTPVVVAGNTDWNEPGEMLIVLGADHVTAHDAADGREIWRVGGLNPEGNTFFRSIASPVVSGEFVIAPYARGNTVTAIRRGGAGDVTASHIVWKREPLGADVPTPAIRDGRLMICGDKGLMSCLDLKTGETIWEDNLPKNRNKFSSSPIIVDDHVLLTREDGHSWCLAWPGEKGESLTVLGEGILDEMTVATPVCLDGDIFLRTHDSLWCIRSK